MHLVPMRIVLNRGVIAAVAILASCSFGYSEIVPKTPTAGETISSVNPGLRAYLDLSGEARREKFKDLKYRESLRPFLGAVPATFTWECTAGEQGPFTIQISEKGDFSEAAPILDVTDKDNVDKNRADIANFFIGRTYYWRVEGSLNGKKVFSKTTSFQTDARPPRLMVLPDVPNFRDMGGWTGLDGRKVKQGMIYRSSGLNANSPEQKNKKMPDLEKPPGAPRITAEGIDYVTNVLGWKTDLDLRSNAEVGTMKASPAGPSVRWVHHASAAYKSIHGEKGVEAMVENFRLFLDPANYPADHHCIGGADRGGSLTFMLNGLLGVDIDDLYRDWEISLRSAFDYEKHMDALVKGLEEYGKPDDPFYKKVEGYLYAHGVTPEEVAKFRELMLEKK